MTEALFDPAPARREPWIREAGWHEDMTDIEYHGDPVVGGSVSSTGARLLATRTPAHFDDRRRRPVESNDTLDFGKVAHARVLGRGTDVAVIRGTGKDPNAWRTAADKEAKAKAEAAGKTPIRWKDHLKIQEMADRLRQHPTAGPLLARPGKHEQVGVWQDPATGVWCRLMADFLPDVAPGARRLIVDYKTTVSADPAEFAKSVANYGYDQQADWYGDGVHALDPRDEPPQFVFIAQEKTPPYGVLVAYLDELTLARGRVRNARARELYRRCTEAGEWPGYPTAPVELSLPGWAANAARDEVIAAEEAAS